MPPKPAFSRSSFKPPGPTKATSSKSTVATGLKTTQPSRPSTSTTAAAATIIDSTDEENGDFDESVLDDVHDDVGNTSTSHAAAVAMQSSQSQSAIPRNLLVRILHENFENGDTRITQDAADVLVRYMEVFVQEAMARAARENGERGGDGFLEVDCWYS